MTVCNHDRAFILLKSNYICIKQNNKHYRHDNRGKHHTLMAVLLPQIGSDFRNRASSSATFGHRVVVCCHSVSQIVMFCQCICIIKDNEHYQQDSKALHCTFVSTCWRFSCLRLGQIFEIEPAAGQCMAIAQRHASLSFLDIDVLPLYMYMKGQWTPPAPLYGPPSHFCGHLLAVLMPQITGDINSTYGELIWRNKFPISGMILSEVSYKVFHKQVSLRQKLRKHVSSQDLLQRCTQFQLDLKTPNLMKTSRFCSTRSP